MEEISREVFPILATEGKEEENEKYLRKNYPYFDFIFLQIAEEDSHWWCGPSLKVDKQLEK